LVVIVVASPLFHLLSPWKLTEVASNWHSMEVMLDITLYITAAICFAMMLFLIWVLIRYRHRPGQRARYEPESRRLEWWLIGLTTVGIVAMLAPGRAVAHARGCVVCHSTDGSRSVGPTWSGLFGAERKLADGSIVVADESYLRRAIDDPNAQVVAGYPALMPPLPLPPEETLALIAYIESLVDG
jgi:heme/copper-type cytochrome/quinol oxidase subunit 2